MIDGMTDKLGSCCRDKLQASEGKLRSAIQDKANVVSEKAGIDRQLKALQAQTGKLTKVTQISFAYNHETDGFQLKLGMRDKPVQIVQPDSCLLV